MFLFFIESHKHFLVFLLIKLRNLSAHKCDLLKQCGQKKECEWGNKIRTPEYKADDCFDSAIGGSAPFMTHVLIFFNNLRHISLSVENLHLFHALIIFSSSRWC